MEVFHVRQPIEDCCMQFCLLWGLHDITEILLKVALNKHHVSLHYKGRLSHLLIPFPNFDKFFLENITQKMFLYFWHLWVSCLLCVFLIHNTNIHFLEDNPTNIHTKFRSHLGEVYSIYHYATKFVSDLQQVGGFLQLLWFPPPNWLPQYNWNIVECGAKHHNHNPSLVPIGPVVSKNKIKI